MIDMPTIIVGVVRKNRGSDDEGRREDYSQDSSESSCLHTISSFLSLHRGARQGMDPIRAPLHQGDRRQWPIARATAASTAFGTIEKEKLEP